MWGRKRIRGPKIIIALIDFNQTVFRLGAAETETVIFNDFLEFKSKIVFSGVECGWLTAVSWTWRTNPASYLLRISSVVSLEGRSNSRSSLPPSAR
jgi:hypothetical protein